MFFVWVVAAGVVHHVQSSSEGEMQESRGEPWLGYTYSRMESIAPPLSCIAQRHNATTPSQIPSPNHPITSQRLTQHDVADTLATRRTLLHTAAAVDADENRPAFHFTVLCLFRQGHARRPSSSTRLNSTPRPPSSPARWPITRPLSPNHPSLTSIMALFLGKLDPGCNPSIASPKTDPVSRPDRPLSVM